MRSTIIPAQITTVEDKIAGSLSLSQISLLILPVFWTALIYVLVNPSMKLSPLKLILVFIASLSCIILAIRVKNKIIASWIGLLINYQQRPRYWLYNKNDLTNRTVDLPKLTPTKSPVKAKRKITQPHLVEASISELVKLNHLMATGKIPLLYEYARKEP